MDHPRELAYSDTRRQTLWPHGGGIIASNFKIIIRPPQLSCNPEGINFQFTPGLVFRNSFFIFFLFRNRINHRFNNRIEKRKARPTFGASQFFFAPSNREFGRRERGEKKKEARLAQYLTLFPSSARNKRDDDDELTRPHGPRRFENQCRRARSESSGSSTRGPMFILRVVDFRRRCSRALALIPKIPKELIASISLLPLPGSLQLLVIEFFRNPTDA